MLPCTCVTNGASDGAAVNVTFDCCMRRLDLAIRALDCLQLVPSHFSIAWVFSLSETTVSPPQLFFVPSDLVATAIDQGGISVTIAQQSRVLVPVL